MQDADPKIALFTGDMNFRNLKEKEEVLQLIEEI